MMTQRISRRHRINPISPIGVGQMSFRLLVRMLYHQYQSKTAMKLGSWNKASLRHVSNDVLSWSDPGTNRPNRLTRCCTQFKSRAVNILVCCICIRMWHSYLNDMEMYNTKRFIPKGFELGTTLSQPIRSIELNTTCWKSKMTDENRVLDIYKWTTLSFMIQ